jgi:hypothetical protein
VAAAAAVVALVAGAAVAAPATDTGKLVVALHTTHHSGIFGTATLTPDSGGFRLTIVLHGAKMPKDQPAHIHNVTCAKYAKIRGVGAQYATVEHALFDVVNGKSVTQIDGKRSQFTTGTYSINVHHPDSPYVTTVCGTIPKR